MVLDTRGGMMDYTFDVQGRVCPDAVVIHWLSVATVVAPELWVAWKRN